jgi:rhodanese-related sulfurtransferase
MDVMPSNTEITVSQLSRLVGLPNAPTIVDVRTPEDYEADPRLPPAAQRRDFRSVPAWAKDLAGRNVVVVCQKGLKLSQGVTAWLLHKGILVLQFVGFLAAHRAPGGLDPLLASGRC